MKVENLEPEPDCREYFRRDRQRFIPNQPGCYVLATFHSDVLYVGLSKNLRRRFGEHLDDPKKKANTRKGPAVYFYWVECTELEKVERTWQNSCELEDGVLPLLNDIKSPLSI